jgi:hypothetical protein
MARPWPPGSDELGQGEEYELRAADVRLYDPDADVKIVDWRTDCFVECGFKLGRATVLALRRDVDRQYVERLLKEGATHDEVWDIVT